MAKSYKALILTLAAFIATTSLIGCGRSFESAKVRKTSTAQGKAAVGTESEQKSGNTQTTVEGTDSNEPLPGPRIIPSPKTKVEGLINNSVAGNSANLGIPTRAQTSGDPAAKAAGSAAATATGSAAVTATGATVTQKPVVPATIPGISAWQGDLDFTAQMTAVIDGEVYSIESWEDKNKLSAEETKFTNIYIAKQAPNVDPEEITGEAAELIKQRIAVSVKVSQTKTSAGKIVIDSATVKVAIDGAGGGAPTVNVSALLVNSPATSTFTLNERYSSKGLLSAGDAATKELAKVVTDAGVDLAKGMFQVQPQNNR